MSSQQVVPRGLQYDFEMCVVRNRDPGISGTKMAVRSTVQHSRVQHVELTIKERRNINKHDNIINNNNDNSNDNNIDNNDNNNDNNKQ